VIGKNSRIYFYIPVLFLIAWAFYSFQSGHPPQLYWDEITHVNGARSILYAESSYSAPEQPPLGREILLASLFLFGDSPAGARRLSTLFGAASIILVFWIAYHLTQNIFVSFWSSLLLLSDPLFYIHSRIGMMDIFVTFFMLLAFGVFLKIRVGTNLACPPVVWRVFVPMGGRSQGSPLQYYLLGTILGIAFSIKMIALVLYPVFWMGLASSSLSLDKERVRERSEKWIPLTHLTLAFTLPTLLVFWLSYAILGFSLPEMKDQLLWFWNFQRYINPHESIVSHWPEWLIVQKPIWYLKEKIDSEYSHAIFAMGNAAFWIFAEIALLLWLFCWRDLFKKYFWIPLIILMQFAFWTFKPAPALYYMLPVLPFYALALGLTLKFLLDQFPDKKRHTQWNSIVFLVCCWGVFVYWYPLIHGKPIETQKIERYFFSSE